MGKDHDLLEASRNGNISLVGKILDSLRKRTGPLSSFRRGPSVNAQDVNGYTALHHACLNGHSNIVVLLLAYDVIPDVPDIRGSTPLYLAAWAGHHDIVKILLMHTNKPANPNAQTIDNETPLHCAAQHGHNAVLSILISYGADPTIRNNSFQTPLDLAAQFGRLQAVQILLRMHPELIDPYKNCAKNIEISAANTPTKLTFTHTCLHLASRNGHKKVVETLLTAGVDVNLLTHAGTALHEAALCGKKSVVLTLLKAGIDPNAKDGNGRTALDLLKVYPPHVTYEIVTAIQDFCKKRTIENENNNNLNQSDDSMRDKSHTMPRTLYEKNSNIANSNGNSKFLTTNILVGKTTKSNGLSCSMSSLEKISSNKKPHYLKMKPILQKSANDLTTLGNPPLPPKKNASLNNLLNNSLDNSPIKPTITRKKFVPKSYEQICLAKSGGYSSSGSANNNIPNRRRGRCVDEYVVMSAPDTKSANNSSTLNVEAKQAIINKPKLKKPFPSPRNFEYKKSAEYGDYANINSVVNSNKAERDFKLKSKIYDANNNKAHSPTPEFPPPTVAEAESTIHEFIHPRNMDMQRASIKLRINESIDNDNPESAAESGESHSLRASDCLEEFISEVPFAGLFKGSTLNLHMDEVEYSILDRRSSVLRSPSLVRSLMKPVPAKRNFVTQKSTPPIENLNESKEWEEINTIFESIGMEVFNANEKNTEKNTLNLKDVLPAKSVTQNEFKMRKPSDLALGISSNLSTNWCHSPNTLIYGQILYNVYYLGSTLIKVLQGTVSTRKSIQKLKRNENMVGNDLEVNLLQDCNTTTKYVKTNHQQTRLEVGIAISHMGVKFMDNVNKNTICLHDIENINCVCQDSEDLRYFAYITKEDDIHYCHVFMVDNLELASEIILTLGQAFEVAYQLAMKRDSISPDNGFKSSDSVFIENE
ncbi:protein phosphatase 1 regulatory subunit 12A-like isoform X2 [Teleopsis dalmanni]|uniref:protein phosphatase 1 regulatory subunit 12A-like isoform X2 n=1 Tax=Teleopsis dalmanni TaxID=139649 RepID=UPI0018CF56E3|nr:protein phosphatase 1 regulatory subunit 12A-like isoform X2 [Teleopsis dalmanni]